MADVATETVLQAGRGGNVSRCKPHVWNYEKWLPIIQGSDPDAHDAIECLNCGRVLPVTETSLTMRVRIAHSMASRIRAGDGYQEIFDSVTTFFNQRLAAAWSRQGIVPPGWSRA